MVNQLNFTIAYEAYDRLEDLNTEEQLLCSKAVEALKTSYSPYSKFKVSAIVRLADGTIVSGSNQENVAYPSGLCAERVALFTVGAAHPNAIVNTMVITADTDQFKIMQPVTCCGSCLQVMAEVERKQGQEIEVLFYCIGGKILKVKGVKSLLPFVFVEDRLTGIA